MNAPHLIRTVTPKAMPWAFEAECSCGWVSREFETHADAYAAGRDHETSDDPFGLVTDAPDPHPYRGEDEPKPYYDTEGWQS